MATKQVAKKKSNGQLAVMSDEMFAADAGAGVPAHGTEDLAIPFLKILQKMSPELDDIDEAKSGDIINTVTKDIIKGKKGVRVVNCAYSLKYIEWEPRGTGTGAPHKIYSSNEEIPTTERGDDNKDYVVDGGGRYLERTAQHYVLIVDEEGFTQQAMLPMKATQFKKSKQWNSAMRALKMRDAKGNMFVPPRFSHVWSLTTAQEENKNGSWHGWIISKDSQIEDPNLYKEAKSFADLIQAGQVKVQHVQDDDNRDDDTPF